MTQPTGGDPDWLFKANPTSAGPDHDGYRSAAAPGHDGDLAAAADAMRDAAEHMRDMATPEPPTKESNWTLERFSNWFKHRPNGRAFKTALYTSGPVGALILWRFHGETGGSGAALAVIAFILLGIFHFKVGRNFTRVLLWGPILALVYFPPALLSGVFQLAQILTRGNK